ncbi:MAG: AI-2E family transporter [Armatimonas sp.]
MIRRDALAAGFSGALGVALLAALLFLGWRFSEALIAVSTPFVAGGAIALLLDPLVGKLQAEVRPLRGKRLPAVVLVFGLFLLGFVALITFFVPMLVGQAQTLTAWFSPATYRVSMAEELNGAPRTVASGLTETHYTVKGLNNGATYYFSITPSTRDGELKPITEEMVKATPMGTASTTQAGALEPTDSSLVAAAGDGEVALAWRVPPGARSGLDGFRTEIDAWLKKNRKIGPITLPHSIDEVTARYSSQLSSAFQKSAAGILATVVGSVSNILSVVLVPIVTFTLLTDMTYLRRRTLFLMPEASRERVARIAEDVGDVFSSYLRGMARVCLAYMAACTICLLIASIWFPTLRGYAMLIGIVAGLLYAVPYVGLAGTLLLTTIVTLVSGAGTTALIVFLLIPIVLNQVFDNILTPRFVGGGIGLHPLLAMLALLVGASLFGLWGMLLAVPMAGSLQVILFRLFPRLAEPTPLVVVRPREEPLPSQDRVEVEEVTVPDEEESQLA